MALSSLTAPTQTSGSTIPLAYALEVRIPQLLEVPVLQFAGLVYARY